MKRGKRSPEKKAKDKLWTLVSIFVRTRHTDPHTGLVPCYTCGVVKHWKEGDAGHAIPGRHNKVLFDLDLLRFQCKSCNGPKSGNQYIFGKKLNEENGDGWFEQKQIDSHGTVKWYLSDYQEMTEAIESMIAEL